VKFESLISAAKYDDVRNAFVKRATSNVRATVRKDLLVHDLGHRISFATGRLFRLQHSSTSDADSPRLVAAYSRLVPASLHKCGNQSD